PAYMAGECELQRNLLANHAGYRRFRIMRRFTSWSMFVPLTLVGLLVPLYAHHGMQFLSNAMEMNQAEIRISDLAAKKAQNPRVKQYAQMLVKDHTQSLEKIRQLRDARLAD